MCIFSSYPKGKNMYTLPNPLLNFLYIQLLFRLHKSAYFNTATATLVGSAIASSSGLFSSFSKS